MTERDQILAEIGLRIRSARKQAGFTGDELAAKIETSRARVSEWENGKGTPSIESLRALCSVLKVSADYLLFGEKASDDESTDMASVLRRLTALERKVDGG